MPRSPKVGKTALSSFAIRLAVIALFVFAVPVTPSFAQASGHVRVKFVKAGLLVGGGTGSGVLTYRGRNYLFRVSGLSLDITAGASVSLLEGWASGIRQVSDFAGTYGSWCSPNKREWSYDRAARTEGGDGIRRQHQQDHDLDEVRML